MTDKKLEFQISKDGGGWDSDLLALCDFPHPWQTTAYAEHLRLQGYEPGYIQISHGGEKIGQCLVSVNKNKIATWLYGPSVSASSPAAYEEVFLQLLTFLKAGGVAGIEHATTQIAYSESFYKEGEGPWTGIGETPFIDIQRSIEEIHKSFDRSVRKNSRKCDEAGVEVVFSSGAGMLEPYLEMLTAHRARLGFPLPPFYPNEDTMRLFSRPGLDMELALAGVGGKWLAALGFVSFGNIVTEVAVGQSDAYGEAKLAAHDIIKVKAVERYRERGVKLFDLAGVVRNPDDEKEKNIRRFKMKFTGTLAEYAVLDRKALSGMGSLRFGLASKIKRAFTHEKPAK